MEGFKASIAETIMKATNISAQRITVTNVRSGSVIADVYISSVTDTSDQLTSLMTSKLGTLFDSQFRTVFHLTSGTSPSIVYGGTETDSPDADAVAAAAAASQAVAAKAGMIVGIEVGVIALIGAVVSAIIIKRRRAVAAASALMPTVPTDRQVLLEVKTEAPQHI